MENCEVTLETAAITPGAVETAQIFARQAKQAGIDVNVKTRRRTTTSARPDRGMNAPFFVTEDGDFTIDQSCSLFYCQQGPVQRDADAGRRACRTRTAGTR